MTTSTKFNQSNSTPAGLYRVAAFIAGGLANVTQLTTYTPAGLKSQIADLKLAIVTAENARRTSQSDGFFTDVEIAAGKSNKGEQARKFAQLHHALMEAAKEIEQ